LRRCKDEFSPEHSWGSWLRQREVRLEPTALAEGTSSLRPWIKNGKPFGAQAGLTPTPAHSSGCSRGQEWVWHGNYCALGPRMTQCSTRSPAEEKTTTGLDKGAFTSS
jgi:hypothetical protein